MDRMSLKKPKFHKDDSATGTGLRIAVIAFNHGFRGATWW